MAPLIHLDLHTATNPTTSLQLSHYTDIVGELQGKLPQQMHVVAPGHDRSRTVTTAA